MPFRFQVDSDFYDHPKSIGLSDAAVALWVRAGSYSMAKLTDGFIPEHVLARLSRDPESASDELVNSGLWRRTRGGHRFHQWADRNLTKAEVEERRNYERERKRRQRKTADLNGEVQASSVNVPRDNRRDNHRDSRRDSERSPTTSVVKGSEGKETPLSPPRGKSGSRRSYDYDEDPNFGRFWSAYPRKVGKPAALKAWKAAIKRGADPERLITAAQLYGADPDRKHEYTKHPGPWLNDERYNDSDQAEPTDSGGWWDN